VDLGSTDRTLEIAEVFKCRIVPHAWVPIVEQVRDEMVNLCTNEWVLLLDPDEIVPPTLAEKLRAVAADDGVDAVSIPWKNYYFGQWIAHSGLNHGNRHRRFFRKGAVKYSTEVHRVESVDGRILELPDAEEYRVTHLGYDSVTQFIQKLDRYTSAEAGKPANFPLGGSIAKMTRAPFSEFCRRYFYLQGYKDGVQGLATCVLFAFYWAATALKVAERNGWSNKDEALLLSQSREGLLRGMADLLRGMASSAESWYLRLIYGVLWSVLALALRIRAF
jgi:hypothetical protein